MIPSEIGSEIYALVADLYPICRSITGNGVRETLQQIGAFVPLEVHEVPSGTQVFDWTVPLEWNIRDAYVKSPQGEKVIDFSKSNLHVLNYSVPIRARLNLDELRAHVATIPEHPDWIPYRTSYYRENWGFCMSHSSFLELEEGEYEVCVDSSLEKGHLTYGEYYLEGESADEVLISTHICHPSLCNDNLSGVALATFLARALTPLSRRLSYRFLFVPGTIGAIAWLYANRDRVEEIKHGIVLTCAGDAGPPTYKKTRSGDADVDRAMAHVLHHSGSEYEIMEFSPFGYDERQYNSPGFALPVGCFMRTPHGRYPEYHTSADDLELVRADSLGDSFRTVLSALSVLEHNVTYVNLNPKCEPQLGRRGLYRDIGGLKDESVGEVAVLWVLNLSDSHHSLLDIAERSGLEFHVVKSAADLLVSHDLLRETEPAARNSAPSA